MDPNASIGRDNDRNSAVRSPRSMRPSSTSVLLPPAPAPPRRRDDQGDSGGRVSRLRTHDSDDDDMTLQSAISPSGQLSVQMPREGAGITPDDLACEGINERGARPSQEDMEPITKAERGRSPSPQEKKAGLRLELASSREPDEDLFVSREVSGSNPLPMQAVAPQGGEQRSMSPFVDKPTTPKLGLAPAREQGPEDLAGRRGAVVPAALVKEHNGANQRKTSFEAHAQRIAPTPVVDEQQEFTVNESEHVAHPGAYPVGIHARHDATEEDTIWGGVDNANEDGAVREDHKDDDLFSAQLVDPEADRLQLHRDVQMEVRREVQWLAQQDSSDKACCIVAGVDCSRRTNQVISILVLALAITALFAALFATDVIGPESSTSAATPSPKPPTPFAPPSPTPVDAAQWVQVGNDIDGENPGDESGSSVALSSNGAVLAIGAPLNNAGGSNAGHVRVYINVRAGWEQRGSDLDGSAAGDFFGWSVSLSADGNILAVGARFADGVNGLDSGQVHVFRWILNTWQPLGSTLDGAGAGDRFGFSVALSDDGTILAVGAAGGSNAGYVRVFTWTVTDWTQRGNDLLGSSPGDFGETVSLSSDGSIVACGGDQGGPGYVRIYGWSGPAWQQIGSTLIGFSSNDEFGESVSLSGDGSIVAVGAWIGNYVIIFRNDGTDWVQIGQTIRGEASGDRFGVSLSLSFDGKTILIGGFWNDFNGSFSGHALVFRISPNGQEWMPVGQELGGEAKDDWFGWSTSMSDGGTRISIGAYYNDGNGDRAGHVRVYDLQ